MQNTQTLDEFLKDRGGQQTFRPGLFETTADLDEITPHKGYEMKKIVNNTATSTITAPQVIMLTISFVR